MDIANHSHSSQTDISLKSILSKAKSGFIAVAIFSLFLNLLMLTAPLYMLQVFDRVLSSHSLDTLFWLTVIAILAFVFLSLLDVVRNRILGTIGAWIDSSLGSILVRNQLHQAATQAVTTPPSSSLRDLSQIRNFLSGNGTLALIDVPWTPFFVVVVYMLHPWLGMMAIGGILLLVLLALVGELSARSKLQKSNVQLSQLYSTIDSASYSADALVSMGALGRITNMWHKANDSMLQHTQQVNGKLASAVASGKFVRLSLQVMIMGLGALLVIREELTPGGMIAASIILTRALAPIEQLIGAWRAFVGSREAMQRVVKQLQSINPVHRPVTLPKPDGIVEANNLAFAIPAENRFLFRDINFTLVPGEVLGIVGPSGSGKTTLAKVLVGLLAPTTGSARIDGSDISHWQLDEMGQYIGYLPQGFELFEGTIRQNIARFTESPIEDAITSAKLAGIHDTIIRLPDGYETRVGKSTPFLSGGQQQRIALARALFGNPSVVVLDEPNANLDPDGEMALLKAINQLRKHKVSVIVIAHRSNILRSADKVMMMHQGTGQMIAQAKPAKDKSNQKVANPQYRYVEEAVNKQGADSDR